nr:hypothetical protein Iba_chr03cCG11420 [Ipomoea batatas]
MQMMICGNRNGMWQHLKLLTSKCRQVFPVASIVITVGSGSRLLLKLLTDIGVYLKSRNPKLKLPISPL